MPEDDPQAGMSWWNSLSEERRAHWLMMAASAMTECGRFWCNMRTAIRKLNIAGLARRNRAPEQPDSL